MAEENTPTVEELKSQSDLLLEINTTLTNNANIISSINEQFSSQTNLITQLNQGIELANNNVLNMNKGLEQTHQIISSIDQVSINFLSQNVLSGINKDIDNVSKGVKEGSVSITDSLDRVSKRNDRFVQRATLTSKELNRLSQEQKSTAEELIETSEEVAESSEAVTHAMQQQQEAIEEVQVQVECNSTWLKSLGNFLYKGTVAFITAASKMLGGTLQTLRSIMKTVFTLPFAVADLGSALGNDLRTEIIEGLGQAFEDLKEKFDMSGYIGENISKMAQMSEDLILEFQKPNSELVKFFGFGTEGLKKYLTSYGEMVEQLGYFGEIFAGEVRAGEQQNLIFTKLRSAAGYTAEDLKYFAMVGFTSLKSLKHIAFDMYESTKEIAESYDIDTKQLSKNFMSLRKDIVLFGHISNDSLNQTAAEMVRMGIRMEDAAAVFNKFSTFEDASNAAAILGQTFGMNLNAMDMIKAEKPDEIFEMFRNAMLDTGRTFDELSRFEKNIMVQQTGMSAESLKAMMNYSAAGLSFEEARERLEESSPEERQLKMLDELQSSIKEFKKVLNSNSFFDAFTKGIMERISYHHETRDTVMALSQGYQGLYEYAADLDPNVISKLLTPIRFIVDTMTTIFEKESFRNGVINILEGFGKLMEYSFGITEEEKKYVAVKSYLNTQVNKEKLSGANKEYIANLIKRLHPLQDQLKLSLSDDESADSVIEKLKQKASATGQDATTLLIESLKEIKDNAVEYMKNAEFDPNALKGTTQDVSQRLEDAAESQKENVGVLATLTKKITKALVVGGMTGFTALLRVLNNQLDKIDINSNTSLLKIATDLDENTLNQLTDAFKEAISGTFARAGKLGGMGLFITGQMMSLFGEIAVFFAEVLGAAIKGIFKIKVKAQDFSTQAGQKRHVATSGQSARGTQLIAQFEAQQAQARSAPGLLHRRSSVLKGNAGVGSSLRSDQSKEPIAQSSGVEESQHVLFINMLNQLEELRSSDTPGITEELKDFDFKTFRQRLTAGISGNVRGSATVTDINDLSSIFGRNIAQILAFEAAKKEKEAKEKERASATKDLLGVFELDNLFPKSEYKFIGRDGKEFDLNTQSGLLGRGDGVVTNILRDKQDMTEDLDEIRGIVSDIYDKNNFKSNRKTNETKKAVLKLNEKLKEATEKIKSGECIEYTPTFNVNDLALLQDELIKAGPGLLRKLTLQEHAQGGYYLSPENVVSTTGQILSNGVPKKEYT